MSAATRVPAVLAEVSGHDAYISDARIVGVEADAPAGRITLAVMAHSAAWRAGDDDVSEDGWVRGISEVTAEIDLLFAGDPTRFAGALSWVSAWRDLDAPLDIVAWGERSALVSHRERDEFVGSGPAAPSHWVAQPAGGLRTRLRNLLG